MYLDKCPRCAWQALETLATHSYCINCNYYEIEDNDYDLYVEKLPDPPPACAFQVKKIVSVEKGDSDEPDTKKIIFFISERKKKAA